MLKITNKDIADKLGGLPPEKMHCSVMGHEALEDALKIMRAAWTNPLNQNQTKDKIICNCFSVTEKQIKEAIEHNGAKTVDDIKELTYICRRSMRKMQREHSGNYKHL